MKERKLNLFSLAWIFSKRTGKFIYSRPSHQHLHGKSGIVVGDTTALVCTRT